MSEPNVLLDIKDRIATVTLNDPERRNPITGNDMIEALLESSRVLVPLFVRAATSRR